MRTLFFRTVLCAFALSMLGVITACGSEEKKHDEDPLSAPEPTTSTRSVYQFEQEAQVDALTISFSDTPTMRTELDDVRISVIMSAENTSNTAQEIQNITLLCGTNVDAQYVTDWYAESAIGPMTQISAGESEQGTYVTGWFRKEHGGKLYACKNTAHFAVYVNNTIVLWELPSVTVTEANKQAATL